MTGQPKTCTMHEDTTDPWGDSPSTRVYFQLRPHHKSRTNRKWLKRYGYGAFSIAVDQVDTQRKRHAVIQEVRQMSKLVKPATPLTDM